MSSPGSPNPDICRGAGWVWARALGLLAAGVLAAIPAAAQNGPDLRIATWNLGWHLDQAQAAQWIAACDAPFARDPQDRRWKPVQANRESDAAVPRDASLRPGWALPWRRDAPIEWDLAQWPPCDVFQDFFRPVVVTPASYQRRSQQIARLVGLMAPDVIAFQEVSGRQAVLEILPEGGQDYEICTFTGYKVQRLAIAWKRRLGALAEPCEVYEALSLPALAPADRLRPGLSIGLRIEGQLIRFLTVHLKSSCVSPLESADPNGRGQLAGAHPACVSLQAQLEPLERWLQDKSAGGVQVVVMGDFNRHLGHETRQPERAAVRLPAGHASDAYGSGVRSTNLWREINDGEPASSQLTLLEPGCTGAAGAQALCEAGHVRPLTREEVRTLASRDALGCRNPVGLDHIAITSGLRVRGAAEKQPLRAYGTTRQAGPSAPDPLLAVSDHCPLTAIIGR